jgi:hypothetical protein
MKAKRLHIKALMREAHRETGTPSQKVHRTLGGDMVPFGCPACVEDIEDRIEDATHARNQCSPRTDARGHYNGLLNVLRRDKRSAGKELMKYQTEADY